MTDDHRYVGGNPTGPAQVRGSQLMVGTRNWKLGPPMRKPSHPEAMPDLRHNLMDGWAKWWPSAWESAPSITTLTEASLWWVGEEMCDLLYSTMASIPPDVEVSHLAIPDRFGLVFFAKEWTGVIDSQTGEPSGNVDCITWADDVRDVDDPDVYKLTVSSYRYLDFGNGLGPWDLAFAAANGFANPGREVREKLAAMGAPSRVHQTPLGMQVDMTGGVWAPLGRSDWPHGWRLDARSAGRFLGDSFDKSAQEDRRLIAALFTLLDTASLATVEERKPSRQVVRNAQRHKQKPPSTVKVVYLRRPKTIRRPGEPESEHHYSHRFAVRAHPRMQAYGPGRKLRKLIMVPAHIKGPQDAPFVAKEEVKAWVR